MNRSARVCFGLILCGTVAAPAVRAQDLPPAPLPPGSPAASSIPQKAGAITNGTGLPSEVKNATDATPYLGQIRTAVQQKVDAITGADPAAQKTARDGLVSELTQGQTPSPGFLDAYASILNAAVLEVLNRPQLPPLRVRLNLAVVVEAVGFQTKNDTLKPVVLKLLADPAEPVLVWGVRAARSIIGAGVNSNVVPKDLLAAIVAVVKAHPASGYLAEEAYHSIVAEGEGVNVGANPATLTPILDAFMEVLNFRVSLYQKVLPDNPAAESFTRFLSVNRAFFNPAQTQQVVQSLTDLISVIGARAAAATKPQLESMCATLRFVGQALIVFSQAADNTALGNMQHVVASSGGVAISQRAHAVTEQLHAQYSFLQAPPQVTPLTTQATTDASSPAAATTP